MSLRALPLFEKVAKETYAGPAPTFSKLHAYKVIMLLGERNLGRNALSQEIGIGSGAVRTLISKLKRNRVIRVVSSGCELTRKGKAIRDDMVQRIPVSKAIKGGRLSVSRFDHAVIVRGASRILRSAIEQRDAAIVQGAKGATTIIFRNGRFALPGDTSDCERDFPDKVWSVIRKELKPESGDVIIVASAETPLKAEYGALAAAWTLIA